MAAWKESAKKQPTMGERKLAIQEPHGWKEGRNRFEAIREFQTWPLSVKLKIQQPQTNKVFQPQVEALCLRHWSKYENLTF